MTVPASTAALLPTDCARALGLGRDDNRTDMIIQVSTCEQKSKNHCCKYHMAPSSRRHSPALQVAVVCLTSAPYRGSSERWCLCSNRRARDVRHCREWVSHPLFAARNQVRASERLARARLCFEMSSRPGKKGPSQFTWNKSPKQSAHVRQSVFEPFVCVVCRVPCVVCSV